MQINRRRFIQTLAAGGGALALGIQLSGCGGEQPWPNAEPGTFQPNAFLRLHPDGSVVLAIHKAEMGQGVITGLATLVGEELELEPLRIRCEFAEPHPDYADPEYRMMMTGGSASIAHSFVGLREAAAAMRLMLVAAAAAEWKADAADCIALDGLVRLRDGSREADYGALAALAARQPVPAAIALKPAAEWRFIGRHAARLDARAKVDGSARFATDVALPGMLSAVIVRCPHFGGALRRVDSTAALAIPGVNRVIELPAGVAVLASGYWAARRGADALVIEWDKGAVAGLDSARIAAEQRRQLDNGDGHVVREDGEPPATTPAQVVEAEYEAPYLAHATMEPLNAVAQVGADGAEIWAGNQAPDVLQKLAARLLGLQPERVKVNSTFLGGGFGRRAMLDYCLEAVLLAQQAGVPVKLQWSREDDMRHDYYRPATRARLRAGISADGQLQDWDARVVGPSIMALMARAAGPSMLPNWVPEGVFAPVAAVLKERDSSSWEGLDNMAYAVPRVRVESVHWDPGVPVGVWRSVGHSQNAFYTESFADEVAAALKEDPVEFRLRRLGSDPRALAVLQLAVQQAGWGRAPAGVFQGVAVHQSFGTRVAEIVELERRGDAFALRRVVCAVDCGTVVNPDVVRAQIESAVVFGLSAALHGAITIADGAVAQGNFDDYPLLRLSEMPASIEVHIVPSEAPPSGIGEPGVPPLAPALANALFAATGTRQRSLPLRLGA